MGASAQPEPDIVAQMRASLQQAREAGASKAQLDFLRREWTRHVQNFNEAEAARTPQTVGEAMAAPLSSAFDAGTYGLAGIVTDALSPGDFRTNRDMRQRAYSDMSTSDRVLSSIAGGLLSSIAGGLNPVNRLIPAAGPGASYANIAARGAAEGAAQGALTGFGENVGASDGTLGAMAAGAIGGGVLGGVAAPIAARVVRGARTPESDAARRAMLASNADNPPAPEPGWMQRARTEVTARIDEASQPGWWKNIGLQRPVSPQPTPLAPVAPGMPEPMVVDNAGPNMLSAVRGSTSTIEGRDALRRPFMAREAEMPRAIGQTFDEVTGTNAADAEALALELAAAERARDAANGVQRAQYEQTVQALRAQHAQAVANARAMQPPPKPQPRTLSEALAALESEGPIPDAVSDLRTRLSQRSAEGRQNYGAAIDATKGTPTDISPEAEAFLRSPTGQAVWKAIVRDRGDIAALDPSRKLPTVERAAESAPSPDALYDAPAGDPFGAETAREVMPDAEAWHLMKQYLQSAAKLGDNEVTPEGIGARQANNALSLLQPVMAQQDELFRAADAAYAERSAPISALKLGMTPLRGNPPVKKAMTRSLTAVEGRVADMTPEEQAALQTGKRFDIASRFRAGSVSASRAADLLAEPSSDLAREVELAYGPGAAQRLSDALRTPAPTPFQRPTVGPFVPPPKPTPQELPTTLAAALRGVDVPRTPSVPTGANPERSLPVLAQDAKGMAPDESAMLQRGAAAGFRREMSAGKKLNLGVPERAAQFDFAARTPADGARMQTVEGAWDAAMQRQGEVLPAGIIPQTPSNGSVIGDLVHSLWYTPEGTAIRTGRTFGDRLMRAAPRAGKVDAAFNALATGRPETLADVLANLATKDQRVQRAASRTAGSAGRAAGGIP